MAKGGILLVAEIGILYLTIYNTQVKLYTDLMKSKSELSYCAWTTSVGHVFCFLRGRV